MDLFHPFGRLLRVAGAFQTLLQLPFRVPQGGLVLPELLPQLFQIAVAFYVVGSWFLMKIFDKAGVQGRWRAWVPVYNMLVFAKLGDLNPWAMLIAIAAGVLLGSIPGLGFIIGLLPLAAIAQLVAHWSGDGALLEALDTLSQALAEAWRQDWSPLVDGLVDAHNLFVLGRGPGLAAAQEAALKFKETCGLHAEAFSSAEVKHGPMAIVGPDFPVLVFAQDDDIGAGTAAVAAEFQARGAPVWLARPGASGPGVLPLPASPHPACTPILTVQAFYGAANALSIARGHDPDVPPHLNKVTETV